jgi:hypothetical protein
MEHYLEVNSDGLAVGGVYQKISGTDPSEWTNWVEISNGAQVGWTWDGSVWTAPTAVLVSVEELRTERNNFLNESDWTQSRDVVLSNDAEWQTYRQALRDITEGYVPVVYPVWPIL